MDSAAAFYRAKLAVGRGFKSRQAHNKYTSDFCRKYFIPPLFFARFMSGITQRIAAELCSFDHPSVDRRRTTLTYEGNKLTIDLFTEAGECVLDHVKNPYFFFPGMQFTVDEAGGKLLIDRFYVRSQFQGRGLGSSLACHLLQAARTAGIRTATLHADRETNAAEYWKRLGFRNVPSKDDPYMEKEL